MRRAVAAALLVGLLAASCSGSESDQGDGAGSPTSSSAGPSSSAPPSTGPGSTETTAAGPPVGIVARQVAELDQPVAMAVRRGDPAVYVAEKTGRVRKLVDFRVSGGPVVDVSGNLSQGYEQGLLGLVFSPDGRYLYVNYTDRAGDTHIAERDMEGGPGLRDVLVVDQPFGNHNGGDLAFGPDGRLYIPLGDGGSGNDPRNNAQNLDSLLGKILRIDPRPSGGAAYSVPPDNPFVGQSGRRGEVWAFGLRNPWRVSFDRATGALWIADVGQGQREEVSMDQAPLDPGRNYEWPLYEGTRRNRGDRPPNGVAPVYEYGHGNGECSVVGGYVYRGQRLRGWQGAYFFADYCVGPLRVLRESGAQDLSVRVKSPSSFGQDAEGELYVLSLEGPMYRLDPQ